MGDLAKGIKVSKRSDDNSSGNDNPNNNPDNNSDNQILKINNLLCLK